jgi:hypothetical protein
VVSGVMMLASDFLKQCNLAVIILVGRRTDAWKDCKPPILYRLKVTCVLLLLNST